MREQRGFTLMEVLVALVMVGLVAAFLTPTFAAQIQHNTRSEVKTQAIEAAQLVLDSLRLSDPATLPSSGTTSQNVSIANRSFSVSTQYCTPNTLCSAVTRHIKVNVRYRNTSYYATETVFTQLR